MPNGKHVLVLAHRLEIINQTSEKLFAHGIEHGIIQAGYMTRPDEPVQVASIQTLSSRMRGNRMELPPADLLIIDEAHHCPANTYREIIAAYPHAILIGLTATPCRGDGRGLGGIFDTIIECPQVDDLIKLGFLVKTRVFAPANPINLKGIQTRVGDYIESQLAERMDRDALVGDIVTQWHKYGERRKTVCFAINVAHSLHIRDEFIKSGVTAAHIDGSTPKPERAAILAQLASGELELVTNCMVLTEGWDMPAVSCAILARPTKKMGLYRQMVGRVLRPADGKTNAIVLDHSGAVFRHGFVEDRVDWTLDPEKRSASPTHAARLEGGDGSRLCECIRCGSLRVGGEACDHCGFMPTRQPKVVVFADGDLAQVDRDSRTAQSYYDPHERMCWHGMLTHIQMERGYSPGWISHKFKEKFGTWPATRIAQPVEPTPEVRSWVRSRNIAYAKAKERAA